MFLWSGNPWDLLAFFELQWTYTKDATIFLDYRDIMWLTQFLIAFYDDFKHARTSLLHRSPLASLENADAKLIFEETILKTLHLNGSSHSDTIVATSSNQRAPLKNHHQSRGKAETKFQTSDKAPIL